MVTSTLQLVSRDLKDAISHTNYLAWSVNALTGLQIVETQNITDSQLV